MPVGEFTKYGLVFASSVIGSIGGYFHSSKASSLRMKMDKRGQRLLRSSDPLWMYERIVTQKKDDIQKEITEVKFVKETQTDSVSQPTGSAASEQQTQTSLREQAYDLLRWCESTLAKGNWSWEDERKIVKFCEYPHW